MAPAGAQLSSKLATNYCQDFREENSINCRLPPGVSRPGPNIARRKSDFAVIVRRLTERGAHDDDQQPRLDPVSANLILNTEALFYLVATAPLTSKIPHLFRRVPHVR